MSEGKDSAIKLFGKMIQIQLESPTYKEVVEESGCGGDSSDQSLVSLSRENDEERAAVEEPNKAELLSSLCNGGNQKAPENDKEESLMSPSKEEHSETSTSEEKALMKKPDKIIPCPRCNSMDTKFCYFNNYNVNQPRHFCKNCQRYWTAGGTMRNVPVGAGRRKNKSAPSLNHHHHPMVIPEARNGLIGPVYTPGSTVLTFGSDAPLCESMASALKIAEKSPDCVIPNGIMKQDLRIQLPFEKRIDGSSIRSEFNLNMMDPKGPNGGNFSGFPGPGWPYTWNPIPLPSALPFPFYATPPFWNTSGSWTLPVSSPSSVSVDQSSTNSSPNSPTLGKHSRDGNTTRDEKAGPGVVTPKMLRINDPNEAAKSSIWGTLGIRNKRVESNNGSGFFKGFESKGEETRSTSGDTSLVLQANPAAFSRSLAFHESIE